MPRALIATLFLAFAGAFAAAQDQISIPRPGDREFIRDYASMIDPSDRQSIEELAGKLLSDKQFPIVVLTVESMAQYGGEGMRIETFALLLYNQWGIGYEEIGGQYWNKGVLLVVSRDDRFARIQLGEGWGQEADATCRQIMDEQIVTRFKQGNFSDGILAGVKAIEQMARGESLPRKPISWQSVALAGGFIALAIFTIVSLIRRGASGWAWLFWGALFSLLGYLLYSGLKSRAGSGGFSGGAFGGGFSGGGGATGSW